MADRFVSFNLSLEVLGCPKKCLNLSWREITKSQKVPSNQRCWRLFLSA